MIVAVVVVASVPFFFYDTLPKSKKSLINHSKNRQTVILRIVKSLVHIVYSTRTKINFNTASIFPLPMGNNLPVWEKEKKSTIIITYNLYVLIIDSTIQYQKEDKSGNGEHALKLS